MSPSPASAETPESAPSTGAVSRLSLRPLKTLAPKPRPVEQPRLSRGTNTTPTSSAVGLRSSTICHVCQRRACTLNSHKAYAKGIKHNTQSSEGRVQRQSHQNVVNNASYANSYAYHFTQSFVDVDIAAGRVDPFYELPIPDSTHPQLHRLFHDCKQPPAFPNDLSTLQLHNF